MSAQEFMNQRAVNLVGGRYSLANWFDPQGRRREFACRATRMNPFRMLMSVPVSGKVGDRVVSYFGEFGTLDGWMADTVSGGVLVDLEADKALRAKLARQLTWLEKKQSEGVREARANGRLVPKDPHSTIIFGDGEYRSCFVVDMSVSGAAISADVQPAIGTPLEVGACVGRVIRHFRDGFAVKFVEQQDATKLEVLVSRPVTWVAQSLSAANGAARERCLLDL
jgi:hypothetical protein